MIVVIQCAATKRPGAGHLTTVAGKPVCFVADPQAAPRSDAYLYARPDDLNEDGVSWRDVLQQYNSNPNGNPLRLCQAHQLYQNKVYQRLMRCCGVANVYILSAGWGLIRAEFLTPDYDITFSASADPYKRRKKSDSYRDFNMLEGQTKGDDKIIFFGGKDYLPLFSKLTSHVAGKKVVFINSAN